MSAGPDLLETIVAATWRAVTLRAKACPIEQLRATITREPQGHRFAEALTAAAAPRVIAECKRRSPSKGIIRADYAPAAHARAYEAAGAAAISVLTEPTFFDGHPDHLREVRAAVAVPILRKDFIISDYQIAEAAAIGADAVLLIVGALPDAGLRLFKRLSALEGLAAIFEVHDERELERAIAAGAQIIGVNSRNLRTLSVDHAVLERLAPAIPDGVTAVAESGIRTREDIERLSSMGYDAFLVGERLIAQPDPGAALRELRGR